MIGIGEEPDSTGEDATSPLPALIWSGILFSPSRLSRDGHVHATARRGPAVDGMSTGVYPGVRSSDDL